MLVTTEDILAHFKDGTGNDFILLLPSNLILSIFHLWNIWNHSSPANNNTSYSFTTLYKKRELHGLQRNHGFSYSLILILNLFHLLNIWNHSCSWSNYMPVQLQAEVTKEDILAHFRDGTGNNIILLLPVTPSFPSSLLLDLQTVQHNQQLHFISLFLSR